jgi:excisionase family DNA binding protein
MEGRIMKENTNEKIVMLTIKEAAALVDGLTEYRVRQLCRSGELPCIKAGKKYLINKDVLIRFLGGDTE